MTESQDPGASLREETDDHDVLTFGEAFERLRQEIAAERGRVRELEENGSDAESSRRRLAELEEAAERYRELRLRPDNRDAFFGTGGTSR
jgi:DNA repair exonuclease SbcCD ATPase subunit